MSLQPFFTPEAIEAESFAIIDREAPCPRPFPAAEWEVARRMIHASGDMDLLKLLVFQNRAVEAGVSALRRGGLVLADTKMAQAGISERLLEKTGSRCRSIFSFLPPGERPVGMTRTRLAMRHAESALPGSILAVGNAPTALIALLDWLDRGGEAPALVLAMPVGFVNAAQTKEMVRERGLPAILVTGRRGGTALAVAAVNALIRLALAEKENAAGGRPG